MNSVQLSNSHIEILAYHQRVIAIRSVQLVAERPTIISNLLERKAVSQRNAASELGPDLGNIFVLGLLNLECNLVLQWSLFWQAIDTEIHAKNFM